MTLFDCLPGVIIYAKDRESRYLAANRAMLLAKNLREPEQLIGKSDRDFHPAALSRCLCRGGSGGHADGSAGAEPPWFVIDRSGSGLVQLEQGASARAVRDGHRGGRGRYPVETPEDASATYRDLAPVVRHLEEHYSDVVPMADMARLAGFRRPTSNRVSADLRHGSDPVPPRAADREGAANSSSRPIAASARSRWGRGITTRVTSRGISGSSPGWPRGDTGRNSEVIGSGRASLSEPGPLLLRSAPYFGPPFCRLSPYNGKKRPMNAIG